MKRIIKPEIISSKAPYKNNYFSVREDRYLLKNIKENGEKETVEKDYFFVDGDNVVVGIVIDDDKVLLVNQYRLAGKGFFNEFVAGMLDADITPEECMKKELLEEAGIEAKNIELLGEACVPVGKSNQKAYVFLIDEFVDNGAPELEEFERYMFLSHKWVSMEEFKAMIVNGKIKDFVTLGSWALYQNKKG